MTEALLIGGLVTLALYVIVKVVWVLCVPEDLK